MISIVIFLFAALMIFDDTYALPNDCPQPPEISNGFYTKENDTNVIYSCNKNYQLVGDQNGICRDGQWVDLPKCTEVRRKSEKMRKKGRRKSKGRRMEILEDFSVEVDFAKSLDLSCIKKGLIRAPRLSNASTVKYARRKKNGHIFMTVTYSCQDGFEFENPEENKLYCSQKNWIGNVPQCKVIDQEETDVFFVCNRIHYGCEHECFYANDKVVCTCYEGFILDKNNGKTCQDINECAKENGGCEGICVNIPGSHECSCPQGLQIDSVNGRSCIDINECLLNNGHGPCQDSCNNNWGSYSCSCGQRDGLRGTRLAADGHTCLSTGNDCLSGAAGCSHDCINLPLGRGAYCTCPRGWMLSNDWKTCQDINECEDIDVASSCIWGCFNTPGSYKCLEADDVTLEIRNQIGDCALGYRRDVNDYCIDINECEEHLTNCTNCQNTEGSYSCFCPGGYDLASDGITCEDINECQSNLELCSEGCMNTKGSFICLCPDGYSLKEDGKSCEDIDECSTSKNKCDQVCMNMPGSFRCSCHEGYELSSNETCEDIDECMHPSICGLNAFCNNSLGSYACACANGFRRSEEGFCSSIDLCKQNNGDCSHYCTVSKYEVICSCPDGYALSNDNVTCEDFDECVHNLDNCEQICENVVGTFACRCKSGFVLNNDNTTCEDIDECTVNNGECSHNCINSFGEFRCSCPDSYILVNNRTCELIAGCSQFNGGCSHECKFIDDRITCFCPEGYGLNIDNKTCTAVDGCFSFNGNCDRLCRNHECRCEDGFILENNTKCVDVDECEENNGGCDDICINLIGSFECSCREGFVVSQNKSCVDKDECLINNGGCSDICINLPGSWQCDCSKGHILLKDNLTCIDIDECVLQNPCSHNCSNIKGGYECLCPKGYKLSDDFVTCVDINECLFNNGGCSDICFNQEGTFECSCKNGHRLENDKRTCRNLNKCANMSCSQRCRTAKGRAECYCKRGYKLSSDLVTCEDINCPEGYIIAKNGRICIKKYLECAPLPSIENGNISCSKADKEKYSTTCVITCVKGYKLLGPSTISCVSSTGVWNMKMREFSCVRQFCPKLLKPKFGRYLPERCNLGEVYPDEKCYLICNHGYKPSNHVEIKCMENHQWDTNTTVVCEKTDGILKPFIQCPNDMKLMIRPNQHFAHVRIPRPKSNVDWWRYVDAFPSWGKQLEGQFPPGITVITFQARSPTSNLIDVCRVIIDVKVMEPLIVKHCPKSFEVFLQPNEHFRSISWSEPQFEPDYQVNNIYKSQSPGTIFYPGFHQINYIASDATGSRVQCDFTINVKDKNMMLRESFRIPKRSRDHFLICDGKAPRRISTLTTMRRTPKGCVVRQIRSGQKLQTRN